MPDYKKMPDRLLETIIEGVYKGKFTPSDLPPELYNETLDRLTDSILSGFGEIAGDDEAELMVDFFRNVNVFSAAKTHQQVKDMSSFIFDEDGFKLPFSKFKEKAGSIFEEYNENYLRTEQNTAAGLAQSARNWKDIERDAEALPLLKFVTSGDDRVRNHHKSLDGIVKPVKDPFWDKYYPPLDWNCRCNVEQIEEGDEFETDLDDIEDLEPPSKLFAHNPAKSRYIFDEDAHPYFKVEDRFKSVEIEGTPIVPKKRVKAPKPAPVVIPEGAFSSEASAKSFLMSTIKKESGVDARGVIFGKGLSLTSITNRVNRVTDLFKEYDLSDALVVEKSKPTIIFRSTKENYGVIKYKATTAGNDLRLHQMNFGDNSDNGTSRLFVKGDVKIRNKSRVDPENAEIATTVHEFAHVIATSDHLRYGLKSEVTASFYRELKILRTEYYLEMAELAPNSVEKYNLSLGRYAGTNIDEFQAEGFCEYKLSSNPSKYATKIGELIDTHFKRK